MYENPGGHGSPCPPLPTPMPVKVYLYRTRPRLDSVREGMVEIKQTKVVYTERESNTEHDFSLFYLDQRSKPRSRSM